MRNGVRYSNGNRALRHLGVPSVTVSMGLMKDKLMPVGVTFAGSAYDDEKLLRFASAYEGQSRRRVMPARTPSLPSDLIPANCPNERSKQCRPKLDILKCTLSQNKSAPDFVGACLCLEGGITLTQSEENIRGPSLEITVDGETVPPNEIEISPKIISPSGGYIYQFSAQRSIPLPTIRNAQDKTYSAVARDKTMVVVLARAGPNGMPTGHLELL